jgi:predicted RNase H-like nuclease
MKVYRVDKLAKPNGMVVKKKHILAASDSHAIAHAEDSIDCPICNVVAEDGRTVGKVL